MIHDPKFAPVGHAAPVADLGGYIARAGRAVVNLQAGRAGDLDIVAKPRGGVSGDHRAEAEQAYRERGRAEKMRGREYASERGGSHSWLYL